jgi:hypothetical protein
LQTLHETIREQELALQRLVPEQSLSKHSRQQQETVAPPHLSSSSPLSPPSSQGILVTVEKAAADFAAAVEVDASEKEAAEKVAAEAAEKTAATWLPRYIAIEVADKGHEEAATKKAAAKKAAAQKAAAQKAAAQKAAALKAAAEKDAAEKAATEKAAAEKAPPREWWQPPDWMGVTAKPSGDAAKAEAEKAEAAEAAAAAAARSPSPLANGTPGRAYNLGGYAPPPSRTKAELKEIIESERQKAHPPLSARLRMPLSPEPWLGGSVSTERHDRLLASRRRLETSKRGLSAVTEAEPSYWSAMGWRSWRASS